VILQLSDLTLEVIGSKWSYALKWCKLNNDDDDDDDERPTATLHLFHHRRLCHLTNKLKTYF